MKRSSNNLTKFLKEGTQSARINFINQNDEEGVVKNVYVFQDVDNAFPDESGFVVGICK